MAPNKNFWILVFTDFSWSMDVGRYSCSDSGEILTLNIGTGKRELEEELTGTL